MGSILLPPTKVCKRCSAELAHDELACPQCHALVHADSLEELATQARALEGREEFLAARELWVKALLLLPPESQQAAWVRSHLHELQPAVGKARDQAERNKWAAKLGPLAPMAVAFSRAKSRLAIPLLTLLLFLGFYGFRYGNKFGLGFVALIFIHEMGHFIDIKRRGLPADMPVFLPGLGAYVRWQALGVSRETRAAVSLAGPLAGALAAAACAILWRQTGEGVWAELARTSALLNILNLIPVWALDGGQAASAMDKGDRIGLLTACLTLWLLLGQSVFALVALGSAYRLFTKDLPARPSRLTTAYFVGVLASLGLVIWLIPGHGLGPY